MMTSHGLGLAGRGADAGAAISLTIPVVRVSR